MSDVAVALRDELFDIAYTLGDFTADDGLETAVVLSFFTDARCEEDEIPFGQTSRRGWWGDLVPDTPEDTIGSKLWLLEREKTMASVAARAKQYALDALQWMIDDGVASSVVVEAEIIPRDSLYLEITITQPKVSAVASFRYKLNWNAQAAA